VSELFKRGSIILTSNKAMATGERMFAENVIASAIL